MSISMDGPASRGREYDVVTFDCYGTLIDWETGIRKAFERLLGKTLDPSFRDDAKLFDLYEKEERRIEAETHFRKYREVMKLSAENVARKIGKKIPPGPSNTFAQEIPKWMPFPETNPALERIAANHRLGILSNVDNDLIAETLRHFTVPFELVITAQSIQSYKPKPRHFEEAKKIFGPGKKWLHVAGSLYHDIEPASAMGIPVVWVNRQHSRSDKGSAHSVRKVGSLTELADWLES